MATYSFPALGFDPAPGDPDAVERVAQDCARAAQELDDGASQLAGMGQPGIWEGEAAEGFKERAQQVRVDLGVSGGACQTVASALLRYADTLRDAQAQARRVEDEAAAARRRSQSFATEIERLSNTPTPAPDKPAPTSLDLIQATRHQQGSAEEEYEAALRRARAIHDWVGEAGDAAARAIAAIDAPYHRPHRSVFSRGVGLVTGAVERVASAVNRFVDEHADLLRDISGALKAVSAAAGLLSFVPVLTPIMAPIATATAVTALGLDATMVAAGHGSWKQVAVDGALMALPGAGRLASRAVMSSQAGRAVTMYADDVQRLNLPSRVRPGTVSNLRTRNFGVSSFQGASRGGSALHPRLQQALDRIPPANRSDFHGKCAEIRAINHALRDGARLEDAVVQTRKVRRLGHLEHGLPHSPCKSCTLVLREFKIKYTE